MRRPNPLTQGPRKLLIVSDQLPGHQTGFQHSGHGHYLDAFMQYFRSCDFEIVLALVHPRLDFLSVDRERLSARVISPACRIVGRRLVVTSPSAVASAIVWSLYERLPRALKAFASEMRSRMRRLRGFTHHFGAFLSKSEVDFVRKVAADERPDVVLFDSVFNCCGRIAPVDHWVLTHDVKYQRAESFAENGVAVRPLGFGRELERAVLAEVGNLVAIQWDDAEEFKRLVPGCRVVVTPVPMTVAASSESHGAIAGRCLFVGSGSFHNYDGLRWFLESCRPRIRAEVPDATLDVCGSVCFRFDDVPAGVTLRGVVEDLGASYRDASLAIVPLRMGSGLKVKLVEALAHALPVVTTPVGAQGLLGLSPRSFLLGASAEEFATQTVALLRSFELRKELAGAARRCATLFTPELAFAEFAAATGTVSEV